MERSRSQHRESVDYSRRIVILLCIVTSACFVWIWAKKPVLTLDDALAKYKHNRPDYPPLHAAIDARDDDAALVMLGGGVDPSEVDDDGSTAMHWAAEDGMVSVVDAILASKYHRILINFQNQFGSTPLHKAARYNHHEILARLLQHPQIEVNEKDAFEWTPLKYALNHGNTEAVQLLRRHGGLV